MHAQVYNVPRFSVHLDACSDSVCHAIFFFSSLGMRLGCIYCTKSRLEALYQHIVAKNRNRDV